MCASLCENRLGLRALVKSWNSLTSCNACYTVLLVFNSRAGFDVLSPVLLFYVFFTSRAEFDVLSPVLLFYVFFTSRAEFDSCKIGFSWRKSWRRGSKYPLDQFCWTTNLRGIRSKKKCHFRQDINATSCVICFLLASLAATPFQL